MLMLEKNNRGFTLLEVLVAVLVLGVGLLGLAQLQTTGLQNTHSANLRTIATQMAYEMSDRIRANRAGFINGDYNNPTISGSPTDCSTSNCSATQMAEYDITEWDAALLSNLINGHGVICIDSTPNDGVGDANGDNTLSTTEIACDGASTTSAGMTVNVYAVKIWWQDERNPATGSQIKRFAIPFVP